MTHRGPDSIASLDSDLDLDTFLDALEAIRAGEDPTPFLMSGAHSPADGGEDELWY